VGLQLDHFVSRSIIVTTEDKKLIGRPGPVRAVNFSFAPSGGSPVVLLF